MKHLLACVSLFVLALLAPNVALAAPGDDCSFLPDVGEQVRCRAASAEPATGPMFAKCAAQMVRGLCDQLADPFAGCEQLPEPKRSACRAAIEAKVERFALADGRQIDVPKSAVFAVRGLQTPSPNDLTMCHAAATFCRERPGSLECLVGLSSWGRTRDWGK
jgi:hypothetical protein